MAERARGWLRTHPTGADVLLALLVFGVSLGPFLNEPSAEHLDFTPFAVVLLAVGSACLVLLGAIRGGCGRWPRESEQSAWR